MKAIGRMLVALCVLMLTSAVAQADITASLDRERVAMGDTLRLTITATDNEDLGNIDLRPLAKNFEILQRSSSSKTSIINGRRSSTNELLIDITPRRQGTLEIPAMRLGPHVTNMIWVAVAEPPAGSSGGQNLLFEAELDRDSVYVQGQVILTLRVQQAINLEDRSITELKLDNAFVRPLEQNSFQRTMDGRPWLVHEVRYAIFPEQSGTLEIPAQTFSGRESVPRRSLFDLGGGGRQMRRSTEPLRIEVLPRPGGYPDSTWLPARSVTLEESWSTPPEQLRVGESATRTVIIRGEGLQGAQLPPVLYPATEGLKYYPDQPVISDGETATGLLGTRQDSVAVVPTRAGQWQIPELRISWWDTGKNELRHAVLPARQLEVAAAQPAAGATTPPPLSTTPIDIGTGQVRLEQATTGYSGRTWQIFSVFNGVGWLLTLAYLVWSRRSPKKTNTPSPGNSAEKPAFKQLLASCADGNALRARQAMVNWAAALLPGTDIVSLEQVANAFNDPLLRAELELLDTTLYSPDKAAWDGAALADIARRLRSEHARPIDTQAAELNLYPQGT